MPEIRRKHKKLFTKNGKKLRTKQDLEAITTLIDTRISAVDTQTTNTIAQTKIEATPKYTKFNPQVVLQTLKREFATMKNSRVFVFPLIWLISNTLFACLVIFLLTTNTTKAPLPGKYSIFAAKPLVLGAATTALFGEDTRAARIDAIFESYRCPLAGYGKKFVKEADKNDIPYWLVPAISFQESACGRKTPVKGGIATYNAWGWGVWGKNVHKFDGWNQGIEVVSKYLGNKFYSKGVTDLCEIMQTYTPPSDGSWCDGVMYFGDIIQEYETPES